MLWKNCAELLAIFGIENNPWVERFVDLVETAALLRHFYGKDYLGPLERQTMRELRLSPLVFWSNLKRAVRPMLSAGSETLRALGVPVVGEPVTAGALIGALAYVLALQVKDTDEDIALQLRELLEGVADEKR